MSNRLLAPIILRASLLSLLLLPVACGRSVGPAVSANPVTISFAAPAYARDAYIVLIAEFKKLHPEITVEILSQGGPGASMELTCASCDVIRASLGELTPERIADFRSLDDLMAGDRASGGQAFPREDFISGTLDALQFEGKQLALPAGVDPIVLFYAPEVFEAAGVAPPRAGWTLDEFVQAGQEVQTPPDAAEPVYGYCPRADLGDAAIFTYLLGGQLVDNLAAATRPTLDTPENVQAVEWWASLRQVYGVPAADEIAAQYGDVRRAIWMGRCAMWIGFYSDRGRYANVLSDTGRPAPGVVPLPAGREAFGVAGMDLYAILKDSQKAEAAWEWVRFLVDRAEAAAPLLPARSSQLGSQAYAAFAGKETTTIATGLPARLLIWDSRLATPALSGTVSAFLEAAEAAARGDADPAAALSEAQAQAEAAFSQ